MKTSPNSRTSVSLLSCLLSSLLLAGCAGTQSAHGDAYDEPVVPGQTRLLNLTGNPTTEGAAEVYFSASSRTEMLVTFRDRLVAFEVDGKTLPGASRGNQLTYPTGYQALALSPGVHSISYCHVTRSDLATGVRLCNFTIREFNFEPNARYMVDKNLDVRHNRSGNTTTETVRVRTDMQRIR